MMPLPLLFIAAGPVQAVLHGGGDDRCTQALAASCDTASAGGVAKAACGLCAGRRQHQLRVAGCTAADVDHFCASRPCAVFVCSGTGSDSNPGTAEAPLRSLMGAVAMARQRVAAGASAGCIIYIAGTHRLRNTLELGPTDANLQLQRWSTPNKQPPLISGGLPVPASRWRATADGIWTASLSKEELDVEGLDSEWQPSSLFVGGQRRARVRTPILRWVAPLASASTAEGKSVDHYGFVFAEDDIPNSWAVDASALSSWRVVAFHQVRYTCIYIIVSGWSMVARNQTKPQTRTLALVL
eukprot:SAG31_NODE_8518_length_1437_cov_1.307175_1_plen_298_part_00